MRRFPSHQTTAQLERLTKLCERQHKRIAKLEAAIEWAIEECVAADRERKEYGGPDVRSLTQPLKGGLRAALKKPHG